MAGVPLDKNGPKFFYDMLRARVCARPRARESPESWVARTLVGRTLVGEMRGRAEDA